MQAGQIYRNGNWWRLRYYETVKDAQGNLVKRRATKKLARFDRDHRTEKDVRALADVILAPLNVGAELPESLETLAGFLEHVYLPACEAKLRPSSYQSYRTMFELLKPHLNGTMLRNFRTIDAERILNAVAAEKSRARTSLNNARNFLSGAFRFAIRTDRFTRGNPVREVEVPKGERPQAANTHAYTLGEVAAILAAMDEPARTVCAVAAFAGLRKSEIMGLRWEDLNGTELYVRRSVWQSFVGETKTASSEAPVPVIAPLHKALEKHRKTTTGEGWIFASERMKGAKPLNLNNLLRRVMRPELEKKKIEWRGWHAFRRGLASNLYALKVPDLVIQRIMRHSDVATTQAHYIKTSDDAAIAAMQTLEKTLELNSKKRRARRK
jgi:integrase